MSSAYDKKQAELNKQRFRQSVEGKFFFWGKVLMLVLWLFQVKPFHTDTFYLGLTIFALFAILEIAMTFISVLSYHFNENEKDD